MENILLITVDSELPARLVELVNTRRRQAVERGARVNRVFWQVDPRGNSKLCASCALDQSCTVRDALDALACKWQAATQVVWISCQTAELERARALLDERLHYLASIQGQTIPDKPCEVWS